MCDSGGEDNDGGAAAHSADFIARAPCDGEAYVGMLPRLMQMLTVSVAVLEEMLAVQKSGSEEEISKYNSRWTLAHFKGPKKGLKRFKGWWVGAISFLREETFSGFNVVSGEDGRGDQRAPLKFFSSVFMLDSPLHADFLEDRLSAQDQRNVISTVRNPAKARKIQEHLRSGLSPSAVSDVSESGHAAGTDDKGENDDEEGDWFSVVAKENESIPQIARKTEVDVQKLVKYNLRRFPDLKVNSRLKQGTELLLPPGADIEDALKLSDDEVLVPKTFVLTKEGRFERIYYIEKFAFRDGAVLGEFWQAAEVKEVIRAACPMPLQAEVLQGMESLGSNEYIMMLNGSDNKAKMPVEKLQAMLVRRDVDLRFTEGGRTAAVDFLCRYAVSELLWKPAPKNDKEKWRKLHNWYLSAADFHKPVQKMLLFFCAQFPAVSGSASSDLLHEHEQDGQDDARALGGQGPALGQNEDDEGNSAADVESESGESGSAMGQALADPAPPTEGSESSDVELNEGSRGGAGGVGGGGGGGARRSSERQAGMQGQRWCGECREFHHHRKRKGCLRHEAQAGCDDKQGEGAGTGSSHHDPLGPGAGTVRRRDDALAEGRKRQRTSAEDGRGSGSPEEEPIGIGENGSGSRSGAASSVDGDEGGSGDGAGHYAMQNGVCDAFGSPPLPGRAQELKLSSEVEGSGPPVDERGPGTRAWREELVSPMGDAEALGSEEMPEEASGEASEDEDAEDMSAASCTGRVGAPPSASVEGTAVGFGGGSGSRSRSRSRGASVEDDDSGEGFGAQGRSEHVGKRRGVPVLPRGVLECQVCMQDLMAEAGLEEQAWNCREGHLLCQRCAAELCDCPTCGASPLQRNRPVEQLRAYQPAAVEVPCSRDGAVEREGRGQQQPVQLDAAAMGQALEERLREPVDASESGAQGSGAGFEKASGAGAPGGIGELERGSPAPNQVRVQRAPLAELRDAPGQNMEVEGDPEEGAGGGGEDAMEMEVEEAGAGRGWSRSREGSASCGRGDASASGSEGTMSALAEDERRRRLSSARRHLNAGAAGGDPRAQEKAEAPRSAGASQGLGMRERIRRCEQKCVEEEESGTIKQRLEALETLLFGPGEPCAGGLEQRLKRVEEEVGLDA